MLKNKILDWMPGIKNLSSYQRRWLKYDIRAGLSVAAVAIPVAIAYSELAGVNAIVGLYSCILPMIAYSLVGSSRQLIVGPDAATCAVMAAVITPLAAGNQNLHWQLVIVMTLMMGMWCLIASRLRLGALADLLSQPILTGLLNGVAITIIVDQVAKILGFVSPSRELIERLVSLPSNLLNSHILTVSISALALVIILLVKKFRPNWPGPLLAIIVATTVVWLTNIDQQGVLTVDGFSSTLPMVSWTGFQPGLMRDLVIPALNLTMISFVSMMLTVRSFAAKNNYEVNADVEFRALGIINIVSGLSQGYAISGASSRTAVNDANGGKSQLVSVIAALMIAAVVLFLSSTLQFIPISALGVVLIYASLSMIDLRGIWQLRRRNRQAFMLAGFTLLSVLLFGVLPGIGLAVLLGLLQFLSIIFRPTEQQLGLGSDGMIHSLGNDDETHAVEGVIIYRFNSPLTYFNAAYFKRRILSLVDGGSPTRWVVIDAVASFTHADISVLATINELKRELKQRNVRLILAGRRTELTHWFRQNRQSDDESDIVIISDLYLALRFINSKETISESTD